MANLQNITLAKKKLIWWITNLEDWEIKEKCWLPDTSHKPSLVSQSKDQNDYNYVAASGPFRSGKLGWRWLNWSKNTQDELCIKLTGSCEIKFTICCRENFGNSKISLPKVTSVFHLQCFMLYMQYASYKKWNIHTICFKLM